MRGMTLCVENLSAWLGKREVIQQVSFSLEPGVIGLLGENGSGKTTLIRAILQLGDKQKGKVILRQREGTEKDRTAETKEKIKEVELSLLTSRERARYLSYVPQETSRAACTVEEFAVLGKTPYLGWLERPKASDYEEARNALSRLGILHLAKCRLDEVSGGERKTAYLARAGMQKADWMLLDEPTAGLDFKRQHLFLRSLSQYSKENGSGAMVTLHDPLLAKTYCDRILVLKDGRLQKDLRKTDKAFEEKFNEELDFLFGTEEITRKGWDEIC